MLSSLSNWDGFPWPERAEPCPPSPLEPERSGISKWFGPAGRSWTRTTSAARAKDSGVGRHRQTRPAKRDDQCRDSCKPSVGYLLGGAVVTETVFATG
jgi:hypothetical protein